MLVGFAEWCEGEEPVGTSDLQTMSAWAAAGTAADKDGELATSMKAWDKLLLQLPGTGPGPGRPLPLLGKQLAVSQALAGRGAAHLRIGEHAEAVSLLRRNVDNWHNRLDNWETAAGNCSSMDSADISEGAAARNELAKALLLLADALDPDMTAVSPASDTIKQASAEEAAKLRVRAKSYDISSAHHLFGRVRSSLGAQCWDSDDRRSDAHGLSGAIHNSSQWSFETSRTLPFPQSLAQNTAVVSTKSVQQTRTLGRARDLDISRTYPRAGSALPCLGSCSGMPGISKASKRGASVSAGSHAALTSHGATLTGKSRTRADVASKLAKLYKQPGFESPMPLWFRGLTSNPSDTLGPLDIAYKQVIGPLDGDGRIRGVPGLVAATGANGALQKRRLILAKMEIQPEIVEKIMAIAGYDPTCLVDGN
jgi:tetratricopeptide (TPR) repeat protein